MLSNLQNRVFLFVELGQDLSLFLVLLFKSGLFFFNYLKWKEKIEIMGFDVIINS